MANRLSLFVAMLVLALMPSDGLAAATPPPLRGTGVPVPGELFSDGERLVGVPDRTGVLVLDAVTGRRGYVPPPGCSPAGVGGGAVAFACPTLGQRTDGTGAIVDLTTARCSGSGRWQTASLVTGRRL